MRKISAFYDAQKGDPCEGSPFYTPESIFLLKFSSVYCTGFLLMDARFLKVGSRIFLRIRRLLGVTSRSSSVSMNSRHCSRLKIRGGVSVRASSALEERVLVRCLGLADVDLDILGLTVLADDHTGIYLLAGADEQGAALLGVEQAVGDGLAGSRKRSGSPACGTGCLPCTGRSSSKMVFRMPFPLVSVRNSPR